ncbi:ribose-phosphate pyrophosphokinase [Thermodesulfitimonas autotrophica]|jgi:ribose-phosphate pyrophosphokinase|uniref:Ribose-phosphate pyrophosphokinase n=3 Tax=Thermodesulfitimonas autotrophica TaxID=1894989 RepID=A0A3N5BEL5_9THEO|nr:ribose-phosphate pyrophosphokinase [Thermodesulfitimonas autotrophica]RPF42471.1 ribose-phosphate pyrophosphokinase [Thermodesulfitimonas autotrophica]
MLSRHKNMRIFSGNANQKLAEEICNYLGVPLGDSAVGRFSDGEIWVRINENVRGTDAFVIQPTCWPVNENLMELLIMIDALRRASARRITAVIPYYGYARQDRKTRGREPITAKLVANLITSAGARRVLTVDLHAGQIQGFFDIPVDHLPAGPMLAQHLMRRGLEDIVVVAPDVGGVVRARELAKRMGAPLAVIDKRRPEPNEAEVMNIIGPIKGKTAVMVDDIIDTAGTITKGAQALCDWGAREVYVLCTHPVFSGTAVERLSTPAIKEILVTNTIPVPPEKMLDKITVVSVAPLLGEAIIRIHEDLSVSKLFD